MKRILILLALMINSCVEPSSGNESKGVPNESPNCGPSTYQQLLCIAGVSEEAGNTYDEDEADCCSETDECNWANDDFCDCDGLYAWDSDDCAE